jgi:uncharacterized protein involved in exopolysaccharide biosynthesis
MKTESLGSVKSVVSLAVLAMGIAIACVGLWLWFRPAQYEATVRLQVAPEDLLTTGASQPQPIFACIQSDAVLQMVVKTLNLDAIWGQKNKSSDALQMPLAIQMLRQKIKLHAFPNSETFEIQLADERPGEAAQIANAIPEAYTELRVDHNTERLATAIKALQNEFQTHADKLKSDRAGLAQLAAQLNVPSPEPADAVLQSTYPVYFSAKVKLANEEQDQTALQAKIKEVSGADDGDTAAIEKLGVHVVAPALLPQLSSDPDNLLGKALVCCGLATLVAGLYFLFTSAPELYFDHGR